MLNELIIELIVKDIKKSTDYYCKYFDFKVDMKFPDNDDFTWIQLTNNNNKIMMQDYNETKKEINNLPNSVSSNIMLLKYNDVSKLKEIYNMIISDNIKIFMDIKETEYGTVEFGVFDPDNNMIIVSVEK